jgi:ubiquinone/menaquinone biosynthesis C-methylase UbiE
MTIPAAFDDVANRYDTYAPQFQGPVAERVVELADLVSGEKVLDIGCGPGTVLIRAAKKVAPTGHATGIDLAPKMLARAADEADRQGVSDFVTLRHGDASGPFGAGRFDVVLSSLVLYLLQDPAAALVAWRELLTPGGRLVFSWGVQQDPDWLPVFEAVEAYAADDPGFVSYTARLPQPDGMEKLLKDCGYVNISVGAETITTVYASAAEFWDSSVSQGPWVSWRNIPPGKLTDARADALKVLETMRGDHGKLTRHRRIAYAIARQGVS